ncbi:MAG: cbb3-type cytochrome oxidase assembly protein CcoS [Sediminibacterium sp.]|nr:cbb3-type cytochrome oxidase assembly protein CcoS [Sediminibacterium sp.]
MSVIIILLIVSLSIAALFLVAFIWNVKNGQYDDEVSPAIRILFDDRKSATPATHKEKETPVSTVENHF